MVFYCVTGNLALIMQINTWTALLSGEIRPVCQTKTVHRQVIYLVLMQHLFPHPDLCLTSETSSYLLHFFYPTEAVKFTVPKGS